MCHRPQKARTFAVLVRSGGEMEREAGEFWRTEVCSATGAVVRCRSNSASNEQTRPHAISVPPGARSRASTARGDWRARRGIRKIVKYTERRCSAHRNRHLEARGAM